MFIRYTQTGGFAGLTKSLEIDTVDLPPSEAADVYKLVDESHWRELPLQSGRSFTDAQYYSVELRDDKDTRSFAFTDGSVPESFQGLLGWLRDHSVYEK